MKLMEDEGELSLGTRRLSRILVDPQLLTELFTQKIEFILDGEACTVNEGLPQGATMENIYVDPDTHLLTVVYEHESFERVNFGEIIPTIKPVVTLNRGG